MTFDSFLREACPPLDLEWRKYRRRAARHGVEGRLRELGLGAYGDYLEHLRADPREAALLPDLMRVTVSCFFREEGEWQDLRERILPGLLAKLPEGGSLSAWSAGCCGGEEPYTLAIVWLEHLQPLHPGLSLEIIATDIDAASLERARRALYRPETLREVPPEIRGRWFSREDDRWLLDGRARGLVKLGKGNILTDPPPLGVDLLLCRYLAFTYYRGERLLAVAGRLREALRPGGILMVGAKEQLSAPLLELFEPVPGSRVFYRRRGEGREAGKIRRIDRSGCFVYIGAVMAKGGVPGWRGIQGEAAKPLRADSKGLGGFFVFRPASRQLGRLRLSTMNWHWGW